MPSNLFCCCIQGQTSKEDTRELPGNEVHVRGGSSRQLRPPVESTSNLSPNGNLNVNSVLGSCLFLTLQPRICHGSGPGAFHDDVYREMRVPRECLMLDDVLAIGWFGNIYKGRIQRPVGGSDQKLVLIRELNIRYSSELEKARFLSDLLPHIILKTHENILPLVGINTDSIPYLAAFQISDDLQMPAFIDLRAYLLNLRENGESMTKEEIACIGMDIAGGLDSLHDRSFVHHDLSTRTCCYVDGKVKIGEIGWSEYKYKEDYCNIEGDIVPLRWLDPHTVRKHGIGRLGHCQLSNIWSFGVTIWEILDMCRAQPYEFISQEQLLTNIMSPNTQEDVKIPRPGDVKALETQIPEINKIIELCWRPDDERPSLSEIIRQFSRVFHPSQRSASIPDNRDLGEGVQS